MRERNIWRFIFFVTLICMVIFFTVSNSTIDSIDTQEFEPIPVNSIIVKIKEAPSVVQEFSIINQEDLELIKSDHSL